MVSIGVNWNGNGPGNYSSGVSNAGESLGEFLGNYVTGNGGKDAMNAAKNQSYIDTNNARIQLIQEQQAKAAAEAEAKRLENEQYTHTTQQREEGGRGFTDEWVRNIPKPQPMDGPAIDHSKFGYYGPQPAVVDPEAQKNYDAQVENYRRMGPAIFESGKNFTDYGTGLSKTLAIPNIQSGNQDQFVRGRALNGDSVKSGDIIPGATPGSAPVPINPDGSASTKANNAQLKIDEARKSRVQGAQDTISQLDKTLEYFDALRRKGEIGPYAGSVVGRAYDKYGPSFFGADAQASGLRDNFDAEAATLQLSLAQAFLKGQGTVTDAERRILSQALPSLDTADPESGYRILKEMSDTAKKVIERNGGALPDPENPVNPYGDQPQQSQSQSIAPGTIMDGHRYLGGNPADPNSWEAL